MGSIRNLSITGIFKVWSIHPCEIPDSPWQGRATSSERGSVESRQPTCTEQTGCAILDECRHLVRKSSTDEMRVCRGQSANPEALLSRDTDTANQILKPWFASQRVKSGIHPDPWHSRRSLKEPLPQG